MMTGWVTPRSRSPPLSLGPSLMSLPLPPQSAGLGTFWEEARVHRPLSIWPILARLVSSSLFCLLA